MQISTYSRPQETTWLWLAKVVTGLLVFGLLLIHLVVNHLVVEGGLLTYADVLEYYSHPVIPVMESIFLIVVVSHALLGVRGIILDFGPTVRVLRGVDLALQLVGVVAVSYGLWLLYTLATRAT